MHHHHKYIKKMRPRSRNRSVPIAAPDNLDLVQHVAPLQYMRAGVVARQPLPPSHFHAPSTVATTLKVRERRSIVVSIPPTAQPSNAIVTSRPANSAVAALPDKGQGVSSGTPSPTAGSYIGSKMSLSETTQHLLIIAGSVGITIAVSFIAFLFWKRRRNRKDVLDKAKTAIEKEPSVSAPLGSNWGTYKWDAKSTFTPTATYEEMVDLPDPAYVRPSTSGSNRAVPTRAPFAPPNKRAAPNPAPIYVPPPGERSPRLRPRLEARTSSPTLPMQRPDTRPSSPSQVSSIPPYLAHMNGNPNPNNSAPPKVSRFSWTNSQAPKTPMDTNRYVDTNRFSNVSEAESVVRYRTVESWVGQQAGRYEEARIQERIQLQLDEALGELNQVASTRQRESSAKFQDNTGKLKTIPLKDSSSVHVDGVDDDEEEDQVTDLSLVPEAARARSVKRTASRAAKHNTNQSDLTVFRAHPGTKVEIPNDRYIPSVILDGKFGPRDTYQRRDSYGN